MSDYQIQVNQYTSGATGHVNITFIGPGGINETYGNNLSPSDGVQREDYKLSDTTRSFATIELSQSAFNQALAFARAADILSNSYYGLCNNCVDFSNEVMKSAGFGDWAITNYLSDGSLIDRYAKVAEYICGSWYVDLGTSAVLDILASTSDVEAAEGFVNAMSWLVDHENGSDFYMDPSSYTYYSYTDPDLEADHILDQLVYYAAELGIDIKYDPIEQKVILGVASPIVLDLAGDGIQTTAYSEHSVMFDVDGDGVKDRTAWISGEDAFLAVDKNGNGQIDGVNELFGGMSRGEGFARLAEYDSNVDGRVDAADQQFSDLLVWRDTNMDGVTDAGELSGAASAGLESISTNYASQEVFQNDNLLGEVAGAVWQGRAIDAIDVYFRFKSGAGATDAVPMQQAGAIDAAAQAQATALLAAMAQFGPGASQAGLYALYAPPLQRADLAVAVV